jgi:predicted TIM-barrel fold metal-dependent hydrolase
MTNAIDSHVHVFCGDDFPFAPTRVYTPDPCQAGTAPQLASILESHGLSHALLVGAQPYDTDNRCMLRSIARSNGRFRGIALVKAEASEAELRTLAEAGVVGIRINLTTDGVRGLTEPGADKLMARVREMGWFVQVHCEHDELAQALPLLRKARVRVMIDHFARPDLRRGLDQPGFQALLALGRDGGHVVKLSGPFRCSLAGPPFHDVDPYIAAAIDAFGLDRCVWGSDWPYVRVTQRIDYGPGLTALRRWLPSVEDRERILWATPSRLFGFKPAAA